MAIFQRDWFYIGNVFVEKPIFLKYWSSIGNLSKIMAIFQRNWFYIANVFVEKPYFCDNRLIFQIFPIHVYDIDISLEIFSQKV